MKPHLVVVGTLSMFCIAVPGESSLLLTSLTKSIKIPSSIKRYNVVETVPRAQPCPAGAEKKREAERELHYPPISCTLRDQGMTFRMWSQNSDIFA